MKLEALLSRLKRVARTALPAPLLIADLFCGCGGFDEGARQALVHAGLPYKLVAVNHWDRAIATHELNHPDADAYQVDVYETKPLEAVPEGELDVLMASPTCVYYSQARGSAPVSWDQRWGRMSPTQVVRWARDLKPRVLIVENVREFEDWGPVCKRRTRCAKHNWAGPDPKKPERDICGKPRKNKAKIYFRRWWRKLELLGYRLDRRILNAADFGDATTRKRLFIVGIRRDSASEELARICWPSPTHAESPELGDLFARGLLPWEGAWKCIDWDLEGESIFTRAKPHAEKTQGRVLRGIVRHAWGDRFAVKLALYMRSLGREVPDVSGDLRRRRTPAANLVMRTAMGQSNGLCVQSGSDPLPTVTTDGGLATLQPFVFGNRTNNVPKTVDQPLGSATTTTGGGFGLVEPFALPQHFGAEARSLELPLPSPVAINRTVLVEPFTFPLNQSGDRARGDLPVSAPLGAIVAKEMRALVEPAFVLSQASGGSARSVSDPVPAIPTEGAHALVAPYYGSSECQGVERPLPTATTRDRFGLVVPVTHQDGSDRVRSTSEPLPTVTTAARGELAFVTAQFGEREGQSARVHDLKRPLPTICAEGRVPLYEGVEIAEAPRPRSLDSLGLLDALAAVRKLSRAAARALLTLYADVDIRLRMLRARELARSMGFGAYKLTGNETEQTRQVGNAVAVGVARALFASVVLGVAA